MKLFASVCAGTVMAAASICAAQPSRAQVIQVADVIRSDDGAAYRGAYGAMPPVPMEGVVVLAPEEIPGLLREQGFSQLGPVFRRGLVYTVAVLNQNGDDGRLIVDARTGEPIRFIPAMRMDSRLRDELDRMYGPQSPPPARFARDPYDGGRSGSGEGPPRRDYSPRTASHDPVVSSPRHAPPALKRAAKAIAKTNPKINPKANLKTNPVSVAVAPAKPPAPVKAQTVQLSGTSGAANAANEPAKTETKPEAKASTVELKPTEPMPPVQTME
jgi:hypothetical protein